MSSGMCRIARGRIANPVIRFSKTDRRGKISRPCGTSANPATSSGAYFKLNDPGTAPLRTTGWHNLKVEITTSNGTSQDYKFYVDNVLSKTISGVELADAVRRISDGDAVFSPRLAGFVLDAFASVAPVEVDPELDQLTAREREVLRHIARGYAYKEIAAELHISVKTVESHVGAVLRKLQLSSRHELTRWATDRRLV